MSEAAALVLYVDDERDNRTLFEAQFKRKFDVVTCASGEEALERVNARVAALLADQRMPGMTGLQLLERVRDLAPSIRRLMITAYDDDEPKRHIDGCIQGYFTKPWDKRLIETALDDAVAEWACAAAREAVVDVDRVVAEDERRRALWAAAK